MRPRSEDPITIEINGAAVHVAAGTTVAAAMLAIGVPCRSSVQGEPRSALCGMGICMECRAGIDGVANVRTCQVTVRAGMQVNTQ